MKTTEKEVRYIADLAHLNLSDDEVKAYQRDLEEILQYVAKLDELDTDNVEPMAQVVFQDAESLTLREDKLKPSMDRKKALSNAPLQGAGQFKVPSIIER
ncbi:MAG: Asp-tRNA(Asn)/Glu-tRNA(Gln) amidotransferase subunit GatC [Pirellulales bacterium]|nr:Asp-tRNA(Asn)/Glu-tRNA(Gln) amidotransferase subunit GatC [Pirellulales bacterium]